MHRENVKYNTDAHTGKEKRIRNRIRMNVQIESTIAQKEMRKHFGASLLIYKLFYYTYTYCVAAFFLQLVHLFFVHIFSIYLLV